MLYERPGSWAMKLVLVCCLTLLNGQEAGAAIAIEADRGYSVEELLREFSLASDQLIVSDVGLDGITLRFLDDVQLDLTLLASVLALHDVELVLERIGDDHIMKAYRQRCGRPQPEAQLWTAIVPIEDATLERVFAQIRCWMVQDHEQMGACNLLPEQGTLVLSDTEPRARLAVRLIEALDQPGPPRLLERLALESANGERVAELATALLWCEFEAWPGCNPLASASVLAEPTGDVLILCGQPGSLKTLQRWIGWLSPCVPTPPPSSPEPNRTTSREGGQDSPR